MIQIKNAPSGLQETYSTVQDFLNDYLRLYEQEDQVATRAEQYDTLFLNKSRKEKPFVQRRNNYLARKDQYASLAHQFA